MNSSIKTKKSKEKLIPVLVLPNYNAGDLSEIQIDETKIPSFLSPEFYLQNTLSASNIEKLWFYFYTPKNGFNVEEKYCGDYIVYYTTQSQHSECRQLIKAILRENHFIEKVTELKVESKKSTNPTSIICDNRIRLMNAEIPGYNLKFPKLYKTKRLIELTKPKINPAKKKSIKTM